LTRVETWKERAEVFARIRAQIRQVLASADEPLDMAMIATEFKRRFGYLPELDRRMRELLEEGYIIKLKGSIPTFLLKRVETGLGQAILSSEAVKEKTGR
jgi:hypothetical protein